MSSYLSDPFVGTLALSRYRVLRHLATGGMGSVYLARTEGAGNVTVPAVVKRVLSVGDEAAIKAFLREAKILSGLRHPNIVALQDFGLESGGYVMVMEYVHGHPLHRWLRFLLKKKRKFPVEVAVHIAIHVLDALHYGHTLPGPDGKPQNVIHRDVTPSNVMVDTHGHVKLVDFGIARSETDRTETVGGSGGGGSVKGKLPYIAPELFRRETPSPATDVYSVGVMLHEILAGKNEIAGENPAATIGNVLELVPTSLDQLRDDVPPSLAKVIARGLAKKTSERFKTAGEFASALRQARTADSDQSQQALLKLIAQDFFDSDMCRDGSLELNTLDQVLRAPAPPITSSSGQIPTAPTTLPQISTGGNTGETSDTSLPPRAATAQIHPPSSGFDLRQLALLGLVAAAISGGTVAIWRSVQTPAAPPPPAHQPPPVATTADVVAAPVPTPVVDAQPPVAAPPPVAPATPSPERMQEMMGVVAQNRERITRCFRDAPSAVMENPALALRIELATTGAVQNASLQPENLGQPTIASCVERAARTLRFAPQPSPVAFRVNLSMQH